MTGAGEEAQVLPDGTTMTRDLLARRWRDGSSKEDQGGNGGEASTMAGTQAPSPSPIGRTVLDSSAWPIVHGSTGMRDNTAERQPVAEAGPLSLYGSQIIDSSDMSMSQMLMSAMLSMGRASDEGGDGAEEGRLAKRAADIMDFNLADANPVSIITQRVNETTQLLWTSTIGNVVVFRQTDGQPDLEKLAVLDHGLNFRFHGSYAMVASTEGRGSGFFTTDNDAIVRFELRQLALAHGGQSSWAIVETGRLRLPSELNPSGKDALVGITLTDDGSVVVCSKQGVLMASAVHVDGSLSLLDGFPLAGHTKTPNAHVSNSIASSGQAVYIVTQRELVRVDFDSSSRQFVFGWASVYGQDEPWYVGRLGPGSGSTPTVTECGGEQLVAITDGALPMKLLWFQASTGQLAGSRVVQFGWDESAAAPTTSEQSVAVDGCKAFVVNNYMGMDSLAPDINCGVGPAHSERQAQLSSFCTRFNPGAGSGDLFIPKACPSAFGCQALGAAVYELNPASTDDRTGLWGVRRVWTRPDVSCGTSIPLISTHQQSRVAYCVGSVDGSPQWSLLGMDLEDGHDRLRWQFYDKNGARNFFSNPFYAGVESVGEDKVAIGSIGGVIYLSTDGNHQHAASSPARQLLSTLQERLSSATATAVKHHYDLHHTNLQPAAIAGVGFALLALLLLCVFRRRVLGAPSPRLPMATQLKR